MTDWSRFSKLLTPLRRPRDRDQLRPIMEPVLGLGMWILVTVIAGGLLMRACTAELY